MSDAMKARMVPRGMSVILLVVGAGCLGLGLWLHDAWSIVAGALAMLGPTLRFVDELLDTPNARPVVDRQEAKPK